MKITDTHVYFWNGFMSNWFKSKFSVKGYTYNCGEQYMMHMKALLCGDVPTANKIMESQFPSEQKFFGRCVQNYDEAAWSANRVHLMVVGLREKFKQNPSLGKQLKDTGDRIIVEASPEDTIWGVGLHETDPLILDEKNWKGQNLLGQVLMKVRETII